MTLLKVLGQLLAEMFLGIHRRHHEPTGCTCHPDYHALGVHAPTQGSTR